MPDRNQITFVSINWKDRDWSAFNKRVKVVFRRQGLKYSGTYAMSLAGNLHLHSPILHEQDRDELVRELGEEFTWGRAVLVKALEPEQTVEAAIRATVQYSYMPPLKKDDLENHADLWNPDGLAQYVRWDQELTKKRKCEGGWTRSEKALGEPILGTNVRGSARSPAPRKLSAFAGLSAFRKENANFLALMA